MAGRQMSGTQDKLLDTTEVGRRLGGAHRNDVLELIRQGKLQAVALSIRGKGNRPRKYVRESVLAQFIDNLPSANIEAARAVKARPRRGRLEEVKTEYY